MRRGIMLRRTRKGTTMPNVRRGSCRARLRLAIALLAAPLLVLIAQNPQRGTPPAPATLGLEQGLLEFDTPDFTLKLVKASQTVAALQPKGAGGFDFTPADRLEARASDRFNSLGDLTFRARHGTSGPWQDYSPSAARHPVAALPVRAPFLAAANLAATLPANCPFAATRRWRIHGTGRTLVLSFELKNKTPAPVQIGALGLPMIFNNMLTGRQLTQMEQVNSFYDPAINEDGGYLQVTRLNGQGPALLVVPDGHTPFEAWRLLNEPNGPNNMFSRGNPYEGSFEWMAHSAAYAENEWKGKQQWNPATMATVAPGQTRTYGVKFLLAPEIRSIEQTLINAARPVAVGISGYILPMDIEGKLYLNYPARVKTIVSEPAAAIALEPGRPPEDRRRYTRRGKTWGRVRLSIKYEDGTNQSLNYYITKPAAQAV